MSLCRDGWGLYHALKEAKITQRRYFAWIAKAWSGDPDAAPYREFRTLLVRAFAANVERTGIEDPTSLRLAALT